ncbi:MAG: PHP domain-containing protein [Ruminococcaceae bacterium]|nr:PHP domain-containing protein [Oscillospiraceae bacterium]
MNKYYYDLHIHSCLSPCGDDDMTPNNIAGMCALNGINIAALTDHNSAKNCPAFFEACKRYGVIPIAGVELSSAEDIHFVCLFPELEMAMEFDKEIEKHMPPISNRPEIFGEQMILNGEDEQIGVEEKLLITATDLWADEAIRLARSFGAHVRPAHIDRTSNGIIAILGDVPREYNFNFVEFNDVANKEEYFDKYQSIADKSVIVSSDAHHLWDINTAENYFEIDDEPYSSANVRRKLFEMLCGN